MSDRPHSNTPSAPTMPMPHAMLTAREVLELIGELYGIEADLRGKPAAERLRARKEKSVPQLATIKTWMTDKLATLPKKSDLAKAIRYSLNQWDALVLYCEEGRAEISNALAEKRIALCESGSQELLVRWLR